MRIKYVAVDVDGTLLDEHNCYDEQRLIKDVAALKQRGITFIIASGNSLDALLHMFKGKVDNFVAENGGRIFVNDQKISDSPHQRPVLKQLLAFVTTFPTPDLLSLSGASQTYIANQYINVPVPFYPHHAYFHQLADVKEPIYNMNVSWFKQRPRLEKINTIVQKINRAFPTVNATYSGAFGIDIIPAGVNKAAGLEQFVKQTGGNLRQLIAFGDTSNDIEMLRAAGRGIAMKNATPDLLAVADQVTTFDNNHAGLLKEVERLFHL
ncbi:Cof-type HAD-IIB family hydrolase [Limosilactobacillus panis]|uniref:HAD-IIB family hydrolase n=1 Tax=Limosilactobacillus panis TaxID=47493 RepID=UPI001C95371B|nr:HAD family hydrolase [Limosilactobacillus panis]QZN92273.1 Cof-type HAD-IIB family hydrolase [Limosilactobacillus panis]